MCLSSRPIGARISATNGSSCDRPRRRAVRAGSWIPGSAPFGPTPAPEREVPLIFGSREWAQALAREVNASSEYRNAAARWGDGFNGNVLLAFERDPSLERPLH